MNFQNFEINNKNIILVNVLIIIIDFQMSSRARDNGFNPFEEKNETIYVNKDHEDTMPIKQGPFGGLFDNEFALCHKKNAFSQKWDCECGFDSVKAVDKKALELRETNKDIMTTFFMYHKMAPTFVKHQYIRYQLIPSMPKIVFKDTNM